MDENCSVLFTRYFTYGKYYFFVWSQFTYKPTKEALSLVDDKKDEDNIVFGQKDAKVGIIFYQGAKVEAEAYSYLGKLLQKMGIL